MSPAENFSNAWNRLIRGNFQRGNQESVTSGNSTDSFSPELPQPHRKQQRVESRQYHQYCRQRKVRELWDQGSPQSFTGVNQRIH